MRQIGRLQRGTELAGRWHRSWTTLLSPPFSSLLTPGTLYANNPCAMQIWAGNVEVSVVGDIDPAELEACVLQYLGTVSPQPKVGAYGWMGGWWPCIWVAVTRRGPGGQRRSAKRAALGCRE